MFFFLAPMVCYNLLLGSSRDVNIFVIAWAHAICLLLLVADKTTTSLDVSVSNLFKNHLDRENRVLLIV